jgi:hypothetical protein
VSAADRSSKKKHASKKHSIVAEALEPAVVADLAKMTITTAVTTTTTDGLSEITTKTAMLENFDSLTHLLKQLGTEDAEAFTLGLGLSDYPSTGKVVLDD